MVMILRVFFTKSLASQDVAVLFGHQGIQLGGTRNICPRSSIPKRCWGKGVELTTPSPSYCAHKSGFLSPSLRGVNEDEESERIGIPFALKQLVLTSVMIIVLPRYCREIAPPQDFVCSCLCLEIRESLVYKLLC